MSQALQVAVNNLSPGLARVLEFGVWSGGTISLIRNSVGKEYEIFGFDTFDGLPDDWHGTGIKKGGFSNNGVIPVVEGVVFLKGDFKDTLPNFLKVYGHKPCALIHIDCDLYSSAKIIFEHITPSVSSGTIIVFDEWFYASDHGPENLCEQRAFYEWVLSHKIDYTFIDVDLGRHREQKIVKIL